MHLGAIVNEYRKENNITMEEFAKASGLSKGYISMLEKNINPNSNKAIVPSIATIKQIALATSMDINDIINRLDANQKILIAKSSELITQDTKFEKSAIKDVGQIELLERYNQLNDLGKKEAINRVEELTHIPRYQLTPVFEIRAAHNDAELTEEELEKMRKDLDDL